MTLRKKIYFIGIATAYCVALLFAPARANAYEATNSAVEQDIASLGKHNTNLTSVEPWIVDGEVVGSVASYIYNDVITGRPADYWELYDTRGDLLAFSWFDKFGIQRTAVDRGIAKEEDKLEGVFVVVADGDAI